MNTTYRKGAVGALADEYEMAIAVLKQYIATVTDQDLVRVVDAATKDDNCRSIQTVLSHVVSSAFSYATYIGNLKGMPVSRPEKKFRTTTADYLLDLDEAFSFTMVVLDQVADTELEQFDPALKIAAAWGQVYDIEQMLEHAIVHILRHRRQIGKFRQLLPEQI